MRPQRLDQSAAKLALVLIHHDDRNIPNDLSQIGLWIEHRVEYRRQHEQPENAAITQGPAPLGRERPRDTGRCSRERRFVVARNGQAKPDQRAFAFQARGDGLYWFGVCAIDKSGRRDPEDIATAPPALKVLIDTSHPPLQVVAVDRVGEEVQVAWECSDSQADPASLKLEYRPAGAEPTAVWTPVPVPPQINGTYRFRPTHGGAITVRMQITDSTGSPGSNVGTIPGGGTPATSPSPSTATGVGSGVPGMAQAGQGNPAFQQAFRDCLKARGF